MADNNNKENSVQEGKKPENSKKLTKEERIAARQQTQQQTEQTDNDGEDYSKGLYGLYPLIQSKEKVDRALVNVSDLNADLADKKVWLRGRLFVSRKTTSIFNMSIIIILRLMRPLKLSFSNYRKTMFFYNKTAISYGSSLGECE